MIESIEWQSFGLGVGGAYAYLHLWLQYPEIGRGLRRWRYHRRELAAQRRVHLVADVRKIQELERSVTGLTSSTEHFRVAAEGAIERIEVLEAEKEKLRAENERLRAQDAKWVAYKERGRLNEQVKSVVTLYSASKKDLPVGRGASSPPVQR